MNYQTLADAIAARFVSVTATSGSETETLSASADLPDTIATRALLVYPPIGTLDEVMGPRYLDTLDFMVKLLRDPASVPARTRWLYAWATVLRPLAQAVTGPELGVAGVTQAAAVSMRVEIDGEEYAAVLFDVVEITIRVQVLENE